MTAFRLLLAMLLGVLAMYTAAVVARHGLDLLPVFFGAIADGGWPGQFNLDFLTLLALSALWTAWRGAFRPAALLLAVAAFLGGGGFLLAYLLWLSRACDGDIARVLLGVHHKGPARS